MFSLLLEPNAELVTYWILKELESLYPFGRNVISSIVVRSITYYRSFINPFSHARQEPPRRKYHFLGHWPGIHDASALNFCLMVNPDSLKKLKVYKKKGGRKIAYNSRAFVILWFILVRYPCPIKNFKTSIERLRSIELIFESIWRRVNRWDPQINLSQNNILKKQTALNFCLMITLDPLKQVKVYNSKAPGSL